MGLCLLGGIIGIWNADAKLPKISMACGQTGEALDARRPAFPDRVQGTKEAGPIKQVWHCQGVSRISAMVCLLTLDLGHLGAVDSGLGMI